MIQGLSDMAAKLNIIAAFAHGYSDAQCLRARRVNHAGRWVDITAFYLSDITEV